MVTKWKVVVNVSDSPLRGALVAASPAEPTLAAPTLVTGAIPRAGRGRLRTIARTMIGEKRYYSEPLPQRLAARAIEFFAPYRGNRTAPPLQDRRHPRPHRKRSKTERTPVLLGKFLRFVVRWEHDVMMNAGFFHVASAHSVLRKL